MATELGSFLPFYNSALEMTYQAYPGVKTVTKFGPQEVTAWDHWPANSHPALPFTLESGIILKIDELYVGMAVGIGPRNGEKPLPAYYMGVRRYWDQLLCTPPLVSDLDRMVQRQTGQTVDYSQYSAMLDGRPNGLLGLAASSDVSTYRTVENRMRWFDETNTHPATPDHYQQALAFVQNIIHRAMRELERGPHQFFKNPRIEGGEMPTVAVD